jgi:arsenite methyltransferase
MSSEPSARADYGLDAPGVVRNLVVATVIGLAVFLSAKAGIWSGQLPIGPHAVIDLTFTSFAVALGCGGMAIWMVWSSKIGKLAERDRLLARVAWTGRERVLDVGCGRGLLLIGAAKRLTSGRAVGIDIWQARDLSGNDAEATLANARCEGVAERVRLETADMRAMPFPDASFEVIVSKAAIHNIEDRAERAKALAEIARVLAPGGTVLIDDIRHLREYERVLKMHGVTEVTRLGGAIGPLLLFLMTWGSLHPGALLARKPA